MDFTKNYTDCSSPTVPLAYSSTAESKITSLIHLSPALIQVVYYIIGITGVIGNSIVVFVMYRTPRLHDVPNYIITNQSIIDLIASFLFLLNYAVFVNPDPKDLPANAFLAEMVCRVWRSQYIYWSCVRVSAANLICLTAERYFAVCHAIAYKRTIRKHHVILIGIFVWVFGCLFQLPMFLVHHVYEDGECRLVWPRASVQAAFGLSIMTTQLMIPVLFMTFVYVNIFKVIRRRIQPLPNNTSGSREDGLVNAMSKRTTIARRNVIKTLMIVTVVYIICWTPIFTHFTIFNFGVRVDYTATVRFIFLAMGFTNVAVNPFIYAFKYRQFQKAFLSFFNRTNVQASSNS